MRVHGGLLLTTALLGAPAGAVEYNQVSAAGTDIAFEFRQMGVSGQGRFRRHNAKLSFDPTRPDAARISIEIDLASIDTGSEEGNEEVKRRTWLDVAGFPKAGFTSSAVRSLGGNRYEVTGKLSIKGASRELAIPTTFTALGSGGRFDGEFLLKRLDYKIGEGVWSDVDTVANEVRVRFRLAVMAGSDKK